MTDIHIPEKTVFILRQGCGLFQAEQRPDTQWVQKSSKHRGVKLVSVKGKVTRRILSIVIVTAADMMIELLSTPHPHPYGPESTLALVTMTSSNGNIFRVTGPLWGESTDHRWIPLKKANDAELWCFLWTAPEQTVEQTIKTPVIWDAITRIMTPLQCCEMRNQTVLSLRWELLYLEKRYYDPRNYQVLSVLHYSTKPLTIVN